MATLQLTLQTADALPENLDVAAALDGIAGDAMQAAFARIAEQLDEYGFPVTGDFAPEEESQLRAAFVIFVRRMLLNNPQVSELNDATDSTPIPPSRPFAELEAEAERGAAEWRRRHTQGPDEAP